MSKKVDFSQIKVPTIEGEETTMDVRKELGQLLFQQGETIELYELGVAMYHQKDKESIEVGDIQRMQLYQFVARLPYVSRTAIQKAIE